jgi:hypothetical protein
LNKSQALFILFMLLITKLYSLCGNVTSSDINPTKGQSSKN